MKTLVIKIHNNTVSQVREVMNQSEAKDLVRDMFFQQFERVMTDEETDDLEDRLEVYNDEDHDNHYTYSINFTYSID
jgi:hypothetical protein